MAKPFETPFDCLIVGGGPAGLSAAVNLARMRRRVLVVDDRDGRSLWGQTNRNYLGFPDGLPASEIRRQGRRQAAKYGAQFMRGRVVKAEKLECVLFHFTLEACVGEGAGTRANVSADDELGAELGELDCAELAGEGPVELEARAVVLATGVRDFFPDFPGWYECVGRSLYWCIQCDGFEAVDRAVAVVGYDEDSAETTLDLLDFTDRVTLVAGRAEGFEVPASRLRDLETNGVAAYPCAVARYVHSDGQIQSLVLDDPGRTLLAVDAVFAYRRPAARNELALSLGVALNPIGQIVVEPEPTAPAVIVSPVSGGSEGARGPGPDVTTTASAA